MSLGVPILAVATLKRPILILFPTLYRLRIKDILTSDLAQMRNYVLSYYKTVNTTKYRSRDNAHTTGSSRAVLAGELEVALLLLLFVPKDCQALRDLN